MEKHIEDLANWTIAEVEQVKIENSELWRENPGKAIRHFYPRLHELAAKNENYGCACFTPAEYQSMGLKPLHFNFYSSVNLFDVHPGCVDTQTFKDRYGLYPRELADEIAAKRALVFINADPEKLTTDEARTLEPLTDPALGQGRLQLTFFRHAAFKQWLRNGLRTKDEGERIYREFFEGCLIQPKEVRVAVFGNPGLRLGMDPDDPKAPEHLKGAILGRWDHVRHFDSDAADQLEILLRATTDYVGRSILFNAVKEVASANITMAKGGLYRMSYPQITQQQEAVALATKILDKSKSKAKSTTTATKGLDINSLSLAALKLILPTIPLPEQFTWEDYNSLRNDGYFEPIQDGIAEALRVASDQLNDRDRDEIERKLEDDYAKHTRAFERYTSFRKITEGDLTRIGSAFLNQPAGLILDASAAVILFASEKIRKQPGHHLAQGVFRANWTRETIAEARTKARKCSTGSRKSRNKGQR